MTTPFELYTEDLRIASLHNERSSAQETMRDVKIARWDGRLTAQEHGKLREQFNQRFAAKR